MTRNEEKWEGRPVVAGILRVIITVAPIVISLVLVTVASRVIPRPASWFRMIAWWVLLSIFATVVLLVFDRVFRRLMPIVAMYKLSLIFPDRAPSRFRAALRNGTVRQLQRKMESGEFVEAAPQEAAEFLIALASTLNTHDRLTRGHTERVRAYSVMIGQEMGLEEHELELLNWSGLVHDIGKLAVPTEILNKKGKPTADEWVILRQHPAKADALVEPLRPWLGEWAESATQHHEYFDGNGYPNGLSGRDITLAGRIVAVADAYDVMTSARSYKKPMPASEARRELAVNSGSQFDPQVVRAFLGVNIGRLRLIAGPLGSIAQLPAGSATIGSAATTGATVAATIAVGAVAGLIGPQVETAAPNVPETVALVAQAPDLMVRGPEDQTLEADLSELVTESGVHITLLDEPANGSAKVSSPGLVSFSPEPNFNGTVILAYSSCFDDGVCDLGSLTFVVEAVNDAPIAIDDSATAIENTPLVIPVRDNDEDVDGDPLTVRSVTKVSGGSAVSDGSTVTFAPRPRYTGPAAFTYTIDDGQGGFASAEVALIVLDDPDRPLLVSDSMTSLEDRSVVIGVLGNDSSDAPLDPSELAVVRPPSTGVATVVGSAVTYVPAEDWFGLDSFDYFVCDVEEFCDIETTTVSVTPVNDSPTFVGGSPPVVLENSGAQVLANWATAIDAGPGEAAQSVTFTVATDNPDLFDVQPTISPTGDLSFKPAPDANGSSMISVTLRDSGGAALGGSDTSTAFVSTIDVTAVNEAPTFTPGPGYTIAEDSGASVVPGWATGIRAGPPDEAGQALSFTVVADDPSLFSTQPAISAAGDLSFTPALDANGISNLTIRLIDDGGTDLGGVDSSPIAAATLEIAAVNDPPGFVAGTDVTVLEDAGGQTIAGWATAITAGPADEVGQTVVFAVVADDPSLFAVQPGLSPSGDLTFTPQSDAAGSATITITASDDGGTAFGGIDTSTPTTVTVTIDPVDDAPEAFDDATATSGPGLMNVPVLDNDIDPDGDLDSTSVSILVAPTKGTAVPNPDGTIGYTPTPGQTGADSFVYQVCDLSTACDTATVTVGIMGPEANADAATTDEDAAPITIDAVANDTDPTPDLDPTSAVVVSPPARGLATANGDGTFDYVSDPNYFGADSFEYQVCDLDGSCAEATVTIDVAAVPDAPGTQADAFVTDRDAPIAVGAPGVLANDNDYDGDPLTAVVDSGPGSGVVTLNPDGSFTYTPNAGFTGSDGFTYTASDGALSSTSTTVSITVDSGVVPMGWFLGDTGPTADDFDLVSAPPTPGDPDPDGDLDPGLTILSSGGSEIDPDPLKYHHWILDPGSSDLAVNGPVTLKLWSTVDGFELGAHVDLSAWLYDCDAVTLGACSPALLRYEDAHTNDWNGGVSDFAYREITLGSLTHTVAPGRVLKLRLMFGHEDVWVAMDSIHPSELELTLTNVSPDAVDDSYPIGPPVLEDGPLVNLDVLSNDVDDDLDPTSLTIEPSPPAAGALVVKGDNTIDYTPAPDFVGIDTFDYRICDLGGLCSIATVTVTVAPVNDPPSFVKGSDQTVPADSGAQARVGWATSLSRGPADETGQTLTFNTTANTNPGLFSAQPQVSSTGTLLFTPAAGQEGSAIITIELQDDGGVADGGIDTSPPQSFEIVVEGPRIVISEFRPSGPGGGDDEFVELFNAGAVAEDLTGWRLHITSALDFDFYTFPAVTLLPGQHYLVTHPFSPQAGFADDTWGGLTYGTAFGDVQVLTPTGTQVDALHYGSGPTIGEGTALPSWNNPAGIDGSWERLFGNAYGNCVDSDDNKADFVRNYGKSMLQNMSSPFTPCSSPPTADSVIIGEVRPNGPAGIGDEFIEVVNAASSTVDIGGWTIEVPQTLHTFAPGTLLAPGETYVIGSPSGYSGLADAYYDGVVAFPYLGNDDSVALMNGATVIDAIAWGSETAEGTPMPSYDGIAFNDVSYVRGHGGCADFDDNLRDFVLSFGATPGTADCLTP